VKRFAEFFSLLPRSLAGRVLLIILAGLVVAHAASFALLAIERERAVDRFAAAELSARIADYVRSGGSTTSPRERGFGPRRLRWQDVDALPSRPGDMEPAPAVFDEELRVLLRETFDRDPVVWIGFRDARRPDRLERPQGSPVGPRLGPPPPGDRVFKQVTVALSLPSGRMAIAESTVFRASLQVPTDAWVAIALIFFVTALFSVFAVQVALQPVRMLAGAAERLSRNIEEPPLLEEGGTEIRAATRAFNRMQDRLRRHVQGRALAFAAMSHDIRTPLTRMRLRLESLGPEARDRLSEDLDEIEAIAKSVLEVTRGLATDEPMTAVSVEEVIERMVRDNAALGRHLAWHGGAAPLVTRATALRRAIANVADNAFKYARDVEIALADSREALRIDVLDRGPGIADEHLGKVTAPFYRVEGSRNRETGGAGLGLAIAKDLVEGMGGELLLANRDGGGLRVTIVLPR
jgi:signal transduction histidine kinase